MVKRQTFPPAPTLTMTRLATVEPVEKFMFDAFGGGYPHGNTLTNPRPCASVTVTFKTTAAASVATPARPATTTSVTDPAGRNPIPFATPS